MAEEFLTLNGVDATTGHYLVPPVPLEQVSRLAQGELLDPDYLDELRWWHKRTTEAALGPIEGVDPKDLAQAGWGVIFAHGDDPSIIQALRPLLDHRRAQAGRLFREDLTYRPGESKQQFLGRYGAAPGPADPDNVPYYLLIVGDPRAIPYTFQYQLDVQYAVGRISFDRAEDYAAYARGVVAAETGQVTRPRRVTLFGARNPGDRATALSSAELVVPLAERLAKDWAGWQVEPLIGEEATKARLAQTLGNSGQAPALLFSATHGVGFPDGHPHQLRRQGALLCQDWAGPHGPRRALDESCYFCSDDLPDDADVAGLIAFHFACYGAGTPQYDDFAHREPGARRQLAPHALVAGLPKRLLSHPGGGALAVIGHIDRAWTYSFMWAQAGRQTQVYESCLARLMGGHPIGSAFEYFNERYAELAADLSVELEEIKYDKVPNDLALAGMWTANNDARDFVILGDPAVRIAPLDLVGDAGPPRETVTIVVPQAREDADLGVPDEVGQDSEQAGSLAEALGDVLRQAVGGVGVLEVATYVAKDLAAVTYDEATGRFEGARLRALSRVTLAGDTQSVVPEDRDEADSALWQAHVGMVGQALAARAQLLRTAGSPSKDTGQEEGQEEGHT